MEQEDVTKMQENKCIEVTVHGHIPEMVNIRDLERMFEKETTGGRVTVPSTDILEHQWKAGFPLHVTYQDAEGTLREEFKKLLGQREDKLKKKDAEIQMELEDMIGNRQTKEETTQNIIDIVKDVVIVNNPNVPGPLKTKMEREVSSALNLNGCADMKAQLVEDLKNIAYNGVQRYILVENKATKAKWGAMSNRRGRLGENRTVAAINLVMEEFQGMSVMGMKTHSFLYSFLDRLNIKLTHQNTIKNGKVNKLGEVEHDHISSWLEEDAFVLNFVQSKTCEVKPWEAPDQARRAEAAFEKAKHALLQLKSDLLTFKELFPDLVETTLRKIR